MKRADEIHHAVFKGSPGRGKLYRLKNSRNVNAILVFLSFSLFSQGLMHPSMALNSLLFKGDLKLGILSSLIHHVLGLQTGATMPDLYRTRD